MGMIIHPKLILFAAQGCGLGLLPRAPGTFGTLGALPLIWLTGQMSPGGQAFFLVSLILAAMAVADQAEKILGKKDPKSVVIDEIAGFCVTLCLVPVTWTTLALGFAAFRFFDVLKPGPVGYFERNYSGGAGIVLDDIMAGVLAALVLKCLYWVF